MYEFSFQNRLRWSLEVITLICRHYVPKRGCYSASNFSIHILGSKVRHDWAIDLQCQVTPWGYLFRKNCRSLTGSIDRTSVFSMDQLYTCSIAVEQYAICWCYPRKLNGGIGSLFDPCVNAIGGEAALLPHHVWRWVIVPLDLVICGHCHYCMIHCAIIKMRVWFEFTRERQHTFNKIIWQA